MSPNSITALPSEVMVYVSIPFCFFAYVNSLLIPSDSLFFIADSIELSVTFPKVIYIFLFFETGSFTNKSPNTSSAIHFMLIFCVRLRCAGL